MTLTIHDLILELNRIALREGMDLPVYREDFDVMSGYFHTPLEAGRLKILDGPYNAEGQDMDRGLVI